MSQDLRKAAQRVLRAQAEGRTPSLADHFAMGTIGDLDPWFRREAAYPFQSDSETPSVSDTVEPVTTRPRPSTEPAPAAPDPVPQDPADLATVPVEEPPSASVEPSVAPSTPEEVMAVRAMFANPDLSIDQARGLAREAMRYIKEARGQRDR